MSNTTSLATKYRPKKFDEVVEQNVVKAILQNQISKNEIKNAYLFCGPAGCGKAQPMYSKILTSDGFIEMGDIQIGTKVYTRLGEETKVLNIYPQGIREIYEIRFNDRTSIRVSDNHLNSVYMFHKGNRKDFVLETKSLINLFDMVDYYIYIDNNPIQFTDKDNENFNYYNYGSIIAYDNFARKSVNIGNEYLLSSEHDRIQLFSGIVNTFYARDVCDSNIIFIAYSIELANDFVFLARSLGYFAELRLSGDNAYIVEISKYKKRWIEDIVYVGDDLCQCIYVEDDDHTYISDDFIPTHNTTNARLFAKAVNGENSSIVELDAATHNGVDDVRKIMEESKYKPIGSKYRVFILDEVHCLTAASWSSMLKNLEEPVPTSLFLLCTTDPQKIPDTIISRVQRFDFKKISNQGIIDRLKYIIEKENAEGHQYVYDEEALNYISKLSDNGMRDAIKLMETALSYNDSLSIENVTNALSTTDYGTMFDLTDAIFNMDKKTVINVVESVHRDGVDLKQFIKSYSNFILDLCKYDICKTFDYVNIPPTFSNRVKGYPKEAFQFFTQLLNEIIVLNTNIKWEQTPKPLIESTLILLCSGV